MKQLAKQIKTANGAELGAVQKIFYFTSEKLLQLLLLFGECGFLERKSEEDKPGCRIRKR